VASWIGRSLLSLFGHRLSDSGQTIARRSDGCVQPGLGDRSAV